jgi:hypothetical protein
VYLNFESRFSLTSCYIRIFKTWAEVESRERWSVAFFHMMPPFYRGYFDVYIGFPSHFEAESSFASTERRGQVVNTPVLFLGGSGFKSRPGDGLS